MAISSTFLRVLARVCRRYSGGDPTAKAICAMCTIDADDAPGPGPLALRRRTASVGRAHPGQHVRGRLYRGLNRQAFVEPGGEAADHVGRPRKAQLDERRGGEARREAVRAQQHEAPLVSADVRVAPLSARV